MSRDSFYLFYGFHGRARLPISCCAPCKRRDSIPRPPTHPRRGSRSQIQLAGADDGGPFGAGFDVVGVDCGFYRDGWLYNDGRPRPLTFTQDMRRLTLTDVEGFDAVVHLGIDKGRHRVALARRDIFYWATLILLCNQLLGVITSLPSLSMAKVFTNLAEVG